MEVIGEYDHGIDPERSSIAYGTEASRKASLFSASKRRPRCSNATVKKYEPQEHSRERNQAWRRVWLMCRLLARRVTRKSR